MEAVWTISFKIGAKVDVRAASQKHRDKTHCK